ncbi:hypothetical protein [Ramlibacter sp.]|uniref:hypothetical protein n=1 Tax=Ramlibacter sp. TaxID=1917967 RepID=UPI0017D048A9|nr:hypothetical protein [Ramlibacter sp.]MBA2674962.1 hypothetical protein [Ramlibacter sp.]
MSRELEDRPLSTADLAGLNTQPRDDRQPAMQEMVPAGHPHTGSPEPLTALFPTELAQEFRARWDAVQIGFVDDPQRAVQQADELVAQVMKSLAQSFAQQRSEIEAGVRDAGHAATENQRIALQRYRSFFQRLLTL